MSKESLEHLSSLMDGELSRETGLFLTRRLSSDEELTQAWTRYHMIRDCMRQPGAGIPVVDLSTRMHQALAEESVAGKQSAQPRWLKPLAGMAVAASVALMAVFAIGPGQPVGTTEVATETAKPFTSPNILSSLPATQAASFSPSNGQSNARLNSYLLRHNQMAGTTTSQGFVSFVPIVASGNDDADVAATPESEEPTADQPDLR